MKRIIIYSLIVLFLLTACSQQEIAPQTDMSEEEPTITIEEEAAVTTEALPQTSTNENTEPVKLELPYARFRITNAEGETLIYDEDGMHGDLQVLSQSTTMGGAGYAMSLTLTVNGSESFVYENLYGNYTFFSFIGNGHFTNISGHGLETITVTTQDGSLSVTGSSIDYRAWLRIGVENYEYFFIKGENTGDFSIAKTSHGVSTQGLNGLQTAGFADATSMTAKVTELQFTGNDSFDLSQTAETGMIPFVSNGTTQTEVMIDVTTLHKE